MGAINQKWFKLIDDKLGKGDTNVGEVVLKFELHSDGKITDMKIDKTSLPKLQTDICKEAVLGGVPYPHWSQAMLKTQKTNSFDVQFSFEFK